MITRRLAAALLMLLALVGAPQSYATTASLSPVPKLAFWDNNGHPLVGGKLFTYIAGTTTKVSTFTDSSGSTSNTNPILLNARGEANVWLLPAQGYKFVLAPANDSDPPTNAFWTVDNIFANGGSGSIAYGTGARVSASTSIQSAIVTLSVSATSPTTQSLPTNPIAWEMHTIKDEGCNAGTFPISVSGSGNLIDNVGTAFTLFYNCESITVQWNGVIWILE